jgi:pyrimidine operon attenuation protein / uracil phosphoribosyltransferase
MKLTLDAPTLYAELLKGVRGMREPNTQLLGITSGGAWLTQALHHDLQLSSKSGQISSAMHRDDFAKRGMAHTAQTLIPFDVNGQDIVLIDDVLYTGRTIRAVLNELFDYGRPARVRLAVLVDRGGRQLPIQADFAAARVSLPESQSLTLAKAADGQLSFKIEEV